jgi:hypothetical protein
MPGNRASICNETYAYPQLVSVEVKTGKPRGEVCPCPMREFKKLLYTLTEARLGQGSFDFFEDPMVWSIQVAIVSVETSIEHMLK